MTICSNKECKPPSSFAMSTQSAAWAMHLPNLSVLLQFQSSTGSGMQWSCWLRNPALVSAGAHLRSAATSRYSTSGITTESNSRLEKVGTTLVRRDLRDRKVPFVWAASQNLWRGRGKGASAGEHSAPGPAQNVSRQRSYAA